ncbi:MAG: hypothetical protein ACXU93_15600 [Thermodesulfobacteriota bacterium]
MKHGYTLKEIADLLRMHYATLSGIVKAQEETSQYNRLLKNSLTRRDPASSFSSHHPAWGVHMALIEYAQIRFLWYNFRGNVRHVAHDEPWSMNARGLPLVNLSRWKVLRYGDMTGKMHLTPFISFRFLTGEPPSRARRDGDFPISVH